MSERKATATAATAPGAMDAKGSKVVERAVLAGKGDAAAREKDHQGRGVGNVTGKTPKKRRKVNHACVYCRRSHMTCDLERPCTRCIKRNIGHLCHDEPRESDPKKKALASKNTSTASVDDSDAMSQPDLGHGSMASAMGPPPTHDGARQRANSGLGLGQGNPLTLVQPDASSGLQANALDNNGNANQCRLCQKKMKPLPLLSLGLLLPFLQCQCQSLYLSLPLLTRLPPQNMIIWMANDGVVAGFSDAWLTAQNFHDMNAYNPNYMIGPDVTHEFNLLNDFLHNSLLDEGGIPPGEAQQNAAFNRTGGASEMLSGYGSNSGLAVGGGSSAPAGHVQGAMLPPPNVDGKAMTRSDRDKTREYYLQAADPSGNDNPEERMSRVLKAKYDAGLLKPFNYINGYARLSKYLDGHIAPSSKQKILRTINQFRPKFREKAQGLTDMQLVYVEMWFERQLMDYDRVFASMAVPACCWRRTGEIFRGNKEMAELINVPVDRLRDGKIALHEILTEESMVRYWEEFGTIAFDPAHDTLLTACSLKNPSDSSDHPIVKCCFSFTIRRDEHKLPALIVGNFLPHDPPVQ
ncbi:hypothetical protein Trco_004469 [Trichoderma cornu-damae]|uniref:Zn(2)-C6 fungal-type domain-containing protein n=1 Tax=Trichoderma cornu-damae TaxID=654480 RepID=A0A9P8QKT9_9HYPO|nr:hypothetical protein Trco_004469 [Trichoderma cornu-damae]